MTLFFNCQDLSKSYGTKLLFKNLSLSLFKGEKVGLIGPNGCGKSTFLNILIGKESPDFGTCCFRKEIKIGYVSQTDHFEEKSIEQLLFSSLDKEELHHDYEKERLVQTWISKLGLEKLTGQSTNTLSGGWKKRLQLACALISSPDLLLLDEPTNHLDMEGIFWLEQFLTKEVKTYLLVSHDRAFLDQMVNRVIEISPVYPTHSFSTQGSYSEFREKKALFLQGQLKQEQALASKARKELEWLSSSPKARTTKANFRVSSALQIKENLQEIQARNRQKSTSITFANTERETKKLLCIRNLSKKQGNRPPLFNNLHFTLSPGTRLGLLGPNGTGKTTLLRLLTGELQPDTGTIKKADGLSIVYFDQHKKKLPGHLSLRQALCPNGDFVLFQGKMIHIHTFCQRFLFSKETLDRPIETLSGGELARIAIAHLILQPADILLLDEPTNDLDIATLETLENSLLDFKGAVVLITHDRWLLGRVCTTFLALQPDGKATFFEDFLTWQERRSLLIQPEKPKEEKKRSKPSSQLSYKEKKEYDDIEKKLSQLEIKATHFRLQLSQETIAQDSKKLQEVCCLIGQIEKEIDALFSRWEELDEKLNRP